MPRTVSRWLGLGRVELDLLAEPLDVGVQGAAVPLLAVPPDPLHALLAGDDVAGLRDEQGQQVELLAGQLDAPGRGASPRDGRRRSSPDRRCRRRSGWRRPRTLGLAPDPAQHGPDAGGQLAGPGGLGDVVGGARPRAPARRRARRPRSVIMMTGTVETRVIRRKTANPSVSPIWCRA